MKLKLITKSQYRYQEAREYCENNKLKFVDLGTQEQLGVIEYLFDVVGTKEQLEQFEDDHIIIY